MNEERQGTNELLSAEEAATKLKVSVSKKTLLKWAREGKIGSVRLPAKMVRFSEEQLSEFIRRMTHDIRPEKTGRRSPGTPAQSPQLPSKPSRKKQPTQSWKELREEIRSWGKRREIIPPKPHLSQSLGDIRGK